MLGRAVLPDQRVAISQFAAGHRLTRRDLFKLKTRTKTKTKDLILQILDSHRVMAVATNRPDGWPQVTMVGYVNDGFLLYCFVDRNSQKCANILRDGRVSIAIGSDASKPCDIKGLSLAGRASIVTGESELGYVSRLRLQRYPEYAVARAPPRARQHGSALDRHLVSSCCCVSNPRSFRCWTTQRASATAISSRSQKGISTCTSKACATVGMATRYRRTTSRLKPRRPCTTSRMP